MSHTPPRPPPPTDFAPHSSVTTGLYVAVLTNLMALLAVGPTAATSTASGPGTEATLARASLGPSSARRGPPPPGVPTVLVQLEVGKVKDACLVALGRLESSSSSSSAKLRSKLLVYVGCLLSAPHPELPGAAKPEAGGGRVVDRVLIEESGASPPAPPAPSQGPSVRTADPISTAESWCPQSLHASCCVVGGDTLLTACPRAPLRSARWSRWLWREVDGCRGSCDFLGGLHEPCHPSAPGWPCDSRARLCLVQRSLTSTAVLGGSL